ncbi:conserved hypothetical protein [Candida dubliniensis CD36]|uniref:Uncharacterized protein n=1 Tax=Candida dubliniensis (strain CD36 / ATCC MYA-646 / CBS 7987 / NCPF 3949 / NRRL Y-17841) TaxID=573826 RepID=B9WDY7_CANDC|nr:conserved hypothetical protein [Candida dubliniensis CD36]CAX42896.1 conserved hypothetical protein [Candida dubliniensis CD36]
MSSSTDTPSLFVTPQTPPRQQQRRRSNPGAISTPVASSVLLTPSTTTKKPTRTPVSQKRKQGIQLSPQANKFPFTPITPQKSPCKTRKNLDLFTSNEKFGVLLPSPSTIGSGRCHNSFTQAPPPLFDLKKVNEFKVPRTPAKQIIDDSRAKESENEDDWEVMDIDEVAKIPREKLKNPFIDTYEPPSPLTHEKNNEGSINYDTHMELINNKTGKKRVVKLTKNQMKIKPKRLSFDNI